MIAVEFVSYVGSFPVVGVDQSTRAEFVRVQLERMRESKKNKPVLLVISLAGIKVCSLDGKNVYMAHALRRISYATCDPEHAQFSFLAREPKDHLSLQYCHAFSTQASDQAEELNSIVGNAFHTAYAAQLEHEHEHDREHEHERIEQKRGEGGLKQHPTPPLPRMRHFNLVTSPCSQPSSPFRTSFNSTSCDNSHLRRANTVLEANANEPWRGFSNGDSNTEMNIVGVQGSVQGSSPYRRQCLDRANGNTKPTTLPGIVPMSGLCGVGGYLPPRSPSEGQPPTPTPSTASSDDANSPTELNSYRRLIDKPPLVKKLALTIVDRDEMRPLVSFSREPGDTPTPLVGGYVNEAMDDEGSVAAAKSNHGQQHKMANNCLSTPPSRLQKEKSPNSSEAYMDQSSDGNASSKRSSRSSSCEGHGSSPSSLLIQDSIFSRAPTIESHSKCRRTGNGNGSGNSSLLSSGTSASTPPPPPESRYDSLKSNNECEERELRRAPWFQAGIPREIALEILGHEPIGTFMVRESTTKLGCYALSLRVPREFQPSGIAHYLIMKTNKGYKIKGFTKEFVSLTALITHHSVMPELLPCPLSLARYNPSFSRQDGNQDLADMEDDPDYNTLSDFRKMMADLNV